MFCDLAEAWDSVMSNPTDVKELIPEFFLSDGRSALFLCFHTVPSSFASDLTSNPFRPACVRQADSL